MRLINALLIFFLLFTCLPNINGQDTDRSYKYSKITLKSGETLKAKNISISDSAVTFLKFDYNKNRDINIIYTLKDIKQIQIADNNNLIPGLIIGTGFGVAAMFIVKSSIENPETIWYGSGALTIERTMAPSQKIAIISCGTLAGTIVGLSTRNGWQTIFLGSHFMPDSIDLNLVLNLNNTNTPGLNLIFKF